MLLIKAIAFVLYGWGGHQTRPYIYKAIRNGGWRSIVTYMIGVILGYWPVESMSMTIIDLAFPGLIPFKSMVKTVLRLGYFSGYVPMGLGTIFGFVLDQLSGMGVDENVPALQD